MAEGRGVAILVGAGDAIGAAVARRFAKGGYTVCICRREAAKSQALVDELKAAGLGAHALSVDARQEAEVQKLFADVESNVGPIEVCLFNAGSNVNKPLLDTTEKLFFRAWELACYAGFLVGREAARVMVPRGHGTIFFTGATASIRGGKGFAAFSSAKFGLRAVAQAMARELGPNNIHVVHLLIDAGVDSETIHQRIRAATGIEAEEIPPDSLILLRHNFLSSVCYGVAAATRTSWQSFDERVDEANAHGCDRVRNVAFRPQGRIPWVDNRRVRQASGTAWRYEVLRGESSPARRSKIRRPRCTSWRGDGSRATRGLRSAQARLPA